MANFDTRYTLIGRALNLNDQDAWNELHSTYEKFIYFLLRKLSVPENDLDDLAQQALCYLVKNLEKYDQSKGKFRNWLSQIVRTSVLMYHRKNKSNSTKLAGYTISLESEDSSHSDLDVLIHAQWESYISKLALERVRNNFRGVAVEAFEMALNGEPKTAIIEKTGLSEGSVHTLRRRVKRSLMLEIKSIISDLEPS